MAPYLRALMELLSPRPEPEVLEEPLICLAARWVSSVAGAGAGLVRG